MNTVTLQSGTTASTTSPSMKTACVIPRACPSSPGYWVRVEENPSLDFDGSLSADEAPVRQSLVQLNTWR